MADSAILTGDFELTEVIIGVPVPNSSPRHVLIYREQPAN